MTSVDGTPPEETSVLINSNSSLESNTNNTSLSANVSSGDIVAMLRKVGEEARMIVNGKETPLPPKGRLVYPKQFFNCDYMSYWLGSIHKD